MKSKILFLTLVMLFCLTVHVLTLSSIAKGQCGTNPLGETSGDTDFYVSKNQNAQTSGLSSSAASSSEKATVTLGLKAVKNATIQSLNPDKPSPQGPGVAIVWKVEAANPNNEEMLYNYLLKGPATGDKFLEKTGWIRESSWTWNTTDEDAGENQIEVRVMRAGANGFESNMTQSFIVSAPTQDSETTEVDTTAVASAPDTSSANDASNAVSKTVPTEVNPHPGSKTADIEVGKPRVAPDEKSQQPATSITGPNMSMPDPSPKSPDQTSSETAPQATETGVGPEESNTSNEVTKTASTGVNPHPASKTADIEVGKPRVAPDERPRQSTTTGGLVSGPNMSMPDPSPKSPNQSSSESAAQATETGVVPPESSIMEVGGKWTVRLENEGATINPLTLIQTGENVMGMGTLNEQNTKLQVSAKGSVSSNAMYLDIWTIVSEYGNKIDKHIELELLNLDRGISGSYEIYSDEELIGKGNATASRSGA